MKNDFEFSGEHFLQTPGTAIGKKFAPAYTNIYSTWHPGKPVCLKFLKLHQPFFGYLDYVFGVWTQGLETFNQFLTSANTYHPTIKLVSHTDKVIVSFFGYNSVFFLLK